MKKLMFPVLAFLMMPACAGFLQKEDIPTEQHAAQDNAPESLSTKAVVFEKQEFALSKKPDPELQAGFQKILDIAYKKAMETDEEEGQQKIGFIYSMRPTGAINPFSEVEVSCIVQERHLKMAGELCGKYFSALQLEYNYLLHPEKRPKEDVSTSEAKTDSSKK